MPADQNPPRLDVFKALGDNTRYAVYLELARSSRPLATAEVAECLELHVNTVRPHLERMREAGLLDVFVDQRGGVGRPQHRYAVASDAPSLGLEPPIFPVAARMLLELAAEAGATSEDAVEIGRAQGRADAVGVLSRHPDADGIDVLVEHMSTLGFDPTVVASDEEYRSRGTAVTVAFAHCPFRDLAEKHPSVVCALHRGMCVGLLENARNVDIVAFRSLVDRDPCAADLVHRSAPAADDQHQDVAL